ncbi:MAG TPA: HEPN domain-containing protein [Anaerolineales bacterium]|nr:HEPN domain-containing protein [Anaerolineales bacterium]
MREADRWLEFARQDFRIAELAMKEGFYNQACFHSEQCVEKVLKAWMVENGKKIPRTHSMADLLTLIPADAVGDMSEEILLLDRFYIPTRYPDALPGSLEDGMPDKDEAIEALDIATRALKNIGAKL